MDLLDRDACYRALQTRDPRFDGRLFVGVRTTGIYCRPICPARTPKAENCRFFPTAAAAQEAGFRPCLRCRPETSPELAAWRGTSNTVTRALALIDEGALDGEAAGVESLAERLGVGGRQLRRLFVQHLGASPLAVAQTRRVLFAKQLVQETRLPMAEVALAAGFGSVRRFNDTFRRLFGRPPSALRRRGRAGAAERLPGAGVTLRIAYRPPYDLDAMFGFLAARAVPGVEVIDGRRYRRTVEHEGRSGVVEVVPDPGHHGLLATIRLPCVRALPAIVARIRRVFDVGADVETIGAHLSRDLALAPLVARRPGLRVPGGWDGFELAVRAVLGQQITIGAARRLAGRIVAVAGERIPLAVSGDERLTHVFPRPEHLAERDIDGVGMPRARLAALKVLARLAASDAGLFRPGRTLEEAVARLRALPGLGEWTAQYVALRALRETDAFPASDVGLLRGAAASWCGDRPSPAALLERAEAWRPWRAYAAQHLWAAEETGHV